MSVTSVSDDTLNETTLESIGGCEILESLDDGPLGPCYRGRHRASGEAVRIKVCSAGDEVLARRFLRAAEVAKTVQHRNIAAILGFGVEGNLPYLVEDAIGGEELTAAFSGNAAGQVGKRLATLFQVAEALAYAHQQGLVHGHLTPASVRLQRDGLVKLSDFGIARLTAADVAPPGETAAEGQAPPGGEATPDREISPDREIGRDLEGSGYLAPEQLRDGGQEPRSDVFAFGVLAYRLLSGVAPFRGKTASAMAYQILYKVPLPLASVWPDCPEPLAELVARCLEKRPERRWEGFDEIVERLREVQAKLDTGQPPAVSDAEEGAAIVEASEAPGAPETAPIAADRRSRPSALDATQPIPPLEAVEPSTEPAPAGDPVPLEEEARRIGELVAQGDLDAARQKLEEAAGRRPEPRPAAAEAPPKPASAKPAPAKLPPAKPPAARAKAAPVPPPATVGSASGSIAVSATRRPAPPWWVWASAGGGLLGVVALTLLLGWGSTDLLEVEVPQAAAVDEPAPAPLSGRLAVVALPWGEVTEITDAAGAPQPLPADRRTPLALELVEGVYSISVRAPGSQAVDRCEVRVSSGRGGECRMSFSQPTPIEYFKAHGWWE